MQLIKIGSDPKVNHSLGKVKGPAPKGHQEMNLNLEEVLLGRALLKNIF